MKTCAEPPETDVEGNKVAYRDVADYPNYRVGDDGSVWSRRIIGGSKKRQQAGKAHNWHLLKAYRRPYGSRYCVVCMRAVSGGKLTCRYVHAIVLEAFVGARATGMECCHNDGDTSNNRLTNLRYDTRQGNLSDMERHGTALRGSTKPNAKLTESQVAEIHRLWREGEKQEEIGRRFGIDQPKVSAIVRRKIWKHVLSGAEAMPSFVGDGDGI